MIRSAWYFLAMSVCLVRSETTCSKQAKFHTYDNMYLQGTATASHLVSSIVQCSHKCLAMTPPCPGVNFKKKKENEKHVCEITPPITTPVEYSLVKSDEWIFMENSEAIKLRSHCELTDYASCKEILKNRPDSTNGAYTLSVENERFQVYCDMANGGFSLAARFSNLDAKNWMNKSGEWWYDLKSAGSLTNATDNKDMINRAFSLVNGTDIKVTRSTDNQHSALFLASSCLDNSNIRQKLSSYGNFRNGVIWTTQNKCFGSCKASFANGSENTKGFKNAHVPCNGSSSILHGGNIGFWCKYDLGDGAVIMIGGGGFCSRADHGIGITEANKPRLGTTSYGYFDFGNDARPPDQAITEDYSLNLWVR